MSSSRHGILLTAVLLAAAAATADVVRGYVVVPDTDAPVADAEVAFMLSGEGGLDEVMRKAVDDEGRFEFAGPFLKPGLGFVLVAFYRDASYPSSPLILGEQKEIVLEVFEPTQDDGAIRVASQHLFLTVGAGHLEVAQLLHLENDGAASYIGHGEGVRRHVTELRLPEAAFAIQSHAGDIVREEAHRAFDTRPLPPGASQIGLTYQIDAADFSGQYIHELVYPTDLLEVYVHPPDIHLHTPFIDRGVVAVQERQYHLYRRENLRAGQSISIPLPLSRPLRWVVKWLGVGLLVAAGGAVLSLSPRRPEPLAAAEAGHTDAFVPEVDPGLDASASRAELEQRRRILLDQLAALDRGASRKTRKAGALRHKRQRLLGQAVAVYRLLDEAGDG